MLTTEAPLLSIVIPVHNQADMLQSCLQHLRQSTWLNYEVMVVDDGSCDASADVARACGCRVIQLGRKAGPGSARNLGAQAAYGGILVFLDADVCVQPKTLEYLVESLKQNSVDAAFGSYDSAPAAPNLVSQFRNLLHHYVHQTARDEATTFWAGCGAIRKSVFVEAGGFDETFSEPSVEDIELGLRLSRAGRRVVVQKQAQVTHLKKWTLSSMCGCDVWRRGVPWTMLIFREGRCLNDLNVKRSQRWSIVLTMVFAAMMSLATLHQLWILGLSLVLIAAMIVADRCGTKLRGFNSLAIPIAVTGIFLAGYAQDRVVITAAVASLVGVVAINWGFYRFLWQVRGTSFAVSIIPLHIVFYASCGISFVIALALLARNSLAHRCRSFWRAKEIGRTGVSPAAARFALAEDVTAVRK